MTSATQMTKKQVADIARMIVRLDIRSKHDRGACRGGRWNVLKNERNGLHIILDIHIDGEPITIWLSQGESGCRHLVFVEHEFTPETDPRLFQFYPEMTPMYPVYEPGPWLDQFLAWRASLRNAVPFPLYEAGKVCLN